MMTFDAADRSTCAVKRQSTSTPLQALSLLNDVQIVEAARFSAQRMFKEGGTDDLARMAYLFRLITGRQPSANEQQVLLQMYQEQRATFTAEPSSAQKFIAFGESKTDPTIPAADLAAGTTLAQALLNHDEAIMRR
jgi:hypothetical protein